MKGLVIGFVEEKAYTVGVFFFGGFVYFNWVDALAYGYTVGVSVGKEVLWVDWYAY